MRTGASLKPLSRSRTSQLTGDCARGRAAGCSGQTDQSEGVGLERQAGSVGRRQSTGQGLPWAGGLVPSRVWSLWEPHCCAGCEWRGGCSCCQSHFLLETGLKGLSPRQRAPERGAVFRSRPDRPGPCPPVVWAMPPGPADQEEQPSPPKPSLAQSLLSFNLSLTLLHRDHCRGSGQAPRFLRTGAACTC